MRPRRAPRQAILATKNDTGIAIRKQMTVTDNASRVVRNITHTTLLLVNAPRRLASVSVSLGFWVVGFSS